MTPDSESRGSRSEAAEEAAAGEDELAERSGAELTEPEDEAAEAEGSVEDEVEALTAELEELRDRHLRLAAEFDNFRKRTMRERMELGERAQAELVKGLLDALDDLARVSSLDAEGQDAGAVLEGVRLVQRKLQNALEGMGLQTIEAEGQPFDPELHEAMTTTPTADEEEDGIVSQELATGYLFKGTLLRPSLVEVKKYREGTATSEADSEG